MLRKIVLLACMTTLMTSCMTGKKPTTGQATPQHNPSIGEISELNYGKRLFEQGDYKRAMKQLLPIAARGNAEAQYAVGYMYYYGYGINRDTESGKFWIQSSAKQNYEPAKKAMEIMHINKNKQPQTSN